MIKKDRVAGVVVAYNIEKETLSRNIDTYIDYVDRIFIIDNSDKNMKLNKLAEDKIKYLSMNGNRGIAKALNRGVALAIDDGYDYVLTMDQDSQFENNLIDEYAKNESDDVIIYSPNYIIERKRTKKYIVDVNELYWTMTSGNLLNLELYKEVGEFKEDFFIDVVDYEYCLRARRGGFRILQCNKARLIHNPGVQKIKKILWLNYKYGYMSPERLYYQIRNLSWVIREYGSIKARKIIIVKLSKIILLFDNKRIFLKMFKKGRKDYKNGKFGKISA